ncbi:hypothetical protein [Alienimonas sp. DA493]|uniref:hypothetical protein n=1 Tax=Alienimonas sp. DA493 TaxID=3373605 RepID=UPI003754370C
MICPPAARLRDAPAARRGGFVLVLVLALLTVCGLVAAGTATRSMDLALEAAAAEEDLQSRWAAASLERSVLGRAEELIAAEAARESAGGRTAWPEPAGFERLVTLNGRDLRLTVADESAKANVNALHRAGGSAAVARAVRASAGPSAPPVRPRPLPGAGPDVPAYESPGQLFELGRRPGEAAALRAALGEVTVADVPLNLARASDGALRTLAGGVATGSAGDALAAARREGGPGSAAAVLARAGLRESDAGRLRPLLSGAASAWSLWVEPAGTAAGPRPLWLLRTRVGGRDYTDDFAW